MNTDCIISILLCSTSEIVNNKSILLFKDICNKIFNEYYCKLLYFRNKLNLNMHKKLKYQFFYILIICSILYSLDFFLLRSLQTYHASSQ